MARQETKSVRTETEDKEGFIYVPSIKLYVAKERSHLGIGWYEKSHFGKNWYEAHEALLEEDSRMLTIPEFVNFLNYLKKNPSYENTQVYSEITQVRNPWRAEWLDAYFEKRKNGFYVLTGNKTKAKKLETALMEDQAPGISLDSWLKNPTSQGLPRPDIAEGDLYYWYPRSGGVAGFVVGAFRAGLGCRWNPSSRNLDIGVRVAKQRE